MDAQIRYARRPDGARTAYAVLGQGPAMLVPPGFLSNLEWTIDSGDVGRQFWDRLAQYRTLILYDRHGCGLSDLNRTDFTAEDDMSDLYAVVDASGAADFDVFGLSFGGGPALRFAAEHPERVRRLIIWGTTCGLLDPKLYPPDILAQQQARSALRRSDHAAHMRLMATQMFPSGVDPETFRRFVQRNDASVTVEMQEKLETVFIDNRALLPHVVAPALVLHRRGDQMVPFIAGEFVARRLHNARFVPLEGDAHLPYFGDSEPVLEAIIDFLGAGAAPTPRALRTDQTHGTAIILFTDIAGSTPLTESMGDATFRDHARTLDDALRTIITDNGGTPIEGKLLGDGVLATFPAASQAIAAALASEAACDGTPLKLHLGIHAGDVIRERDNVFGGAVNLASRICSLSQPGEILVSATVRDLARTSAGVSFDDRGQHDLKGIADPVHLFAVR